MRHPSRSTTATVQTLDVLAFLRAAGPPGAPFDLVFCDPPYEARGRELDGSLLEAADGWVASEGSTVVLTRGERSSMPVIPVHWAVARQLRYGDSLVHLIRPDDGPSDQVEDLP